MLTNLRIFTTSLLDIVSGAEISSALMPITYQQVSESIAITWAIMSTTRSLCYPSIFAFEVPVTAQTRPIMEEILLELRNAD